MWVFVAYITDELILGLDLLHCYDASVDIRRQKLRLPEEKISLWNPGVGPRTFILLVAKDHVIPAQCEGIVLARMESPFGMENDLVEPNPQSHPTEGSYITTILVQDRQEVPVRILNTTHREQISRDHPLCRTASPLRWWLHPVSGSHRPKT
jgi:hypothetical protein